jgi:hypothetical protein
MSNTTNYLVKNRSAGVVTYSVPELGVKRTFAPGEIKRINFDELQKLSYQPGGMILIAEYLMIGKEVLKELEIQVEQEYDYDENDIIGLIKNGTIDQWIDCLNFAPTGVLDLVKALSVSVPLENFEKKKAIKEILGFDVDAAFANNQNTEDEDKTNKPTRRVQKTNAAAGSARRSTPYKVVNKG